MTTPSPFRPPTAIDRIVDAYLDASTELSPLKATYLGVEHGQDQIDDLGIPGLQEQVQLARTTLTELAHHTPIDEVDRITVAAFTERSELLVEMAQRVIDGIDPVELNVIASPAQTLRDIFDLMPRDTAEQWELIIGRLHAVPTALGQYTEALRHSLSHGVLPPRRQVEAVAAQCRDQAGEASTFDALLTAAQSEPDELRDRLGAAIDAAKQGYGDLAGVLADELLPHAPEQDAVGRERYQLASRFYLGATIDLEETYAWGQQELARITELMQQTADQIVPGGSITEAIEALDADPAYQLHGTAELREWMQVKADEAVELLADSQFDVPEPVRTIECMIAPSQTGGIYYTPPSEDFSRPGRMWWSVPKGVTEFTTWRELTTVYHEGVPGHHLQLGQTAYRSELLNRWRRLDSFTSGHGEGWALYAEWLMADLGYMDDPGMRMGLLDGQSLRSARVVLDIGIHCGFEAPAEVGGGDWTYDKAWEFLSRYAHMDDGFLRFELDRYLGWPGQAPAYKIGERLWLQLRDDVREREGEGFDLQAFHRRALDIGGVGLDTLRDAVLGA